MNIPIAQKEPCANCGSLADPVHRTADDDGNRLEKPVLRGWFCAQCGHLTPPIGRERGLGVKP